MGLGDNLMATGLAKGAKARGKRIAFGDGKRIIWDQHSASIFQDNPNIAPPGSENDSDIEWVPFYKGHRIYNEHDRINNKWKWNLEFKAVPGEIFLSASELKWASRFGKDFIVVEKTIRSKPGTINKQWAQHRYDEIIRRLKQSGHQVVEFDGAAPSFRHAVAALSKAKLYIGPEGGLHHGAAAVGIPAVVIFGSWIPPQVTGYETHENLTGDANDFCGRLDFCSHCRKTLDSIKIKHVHHAAKEFLNDC